MRNFIFVLIGFVMLSSCASSKNKPAWAGEQPPAGVYWGIGSARESTDSLSRITAENRARVDIARQIAKTESPDGDSLIITVELENAKVIQSWKANDGTWWCRVEYKIGGED
ncbi:hypothetical protein FACS1894151_01560 [Spirochaetia bacterium]|nr:hypothetical protein FACS1894151_01560 [Spirochaetia bacterium]